jgi:hypothetical protein
MLSSETTESLSELGMSLHTAISIVNMGLGGLRCYDACRRAWKSVNYLIVVLLYKG